MLKIKKHGVLLSPRDLKFEEDGVLNPAVYQDGDNLHLYYRAVSKGNYSTIGYASINGPLDIVKQLDKPLIGIEREEENHGVEDPRIVKIDGEFILSYTAYDGNLAAGAIATGDNPLKFKKQGIITPLIKKEFFREFIKRQSKNKKYCHYLNFMEQEGYTTPSEYLWNKDFVYFPRKINNKFVFMHRIYPSIQLVEYEKLSDFTDEYWQNYLETLIEKTAISPVINGHRFYLGGGAPPIETEDGWLVIFHCVDYRKSQKIYSAKAALLDINNPFKLKAIIKEPIFFPSEPWELTGYVNNVVFPTGTSIFGDDLYIYYGAADSKVAVASVKLSDLLYKLQKNKI